MCTRGPSPKGDKIVTTIDEGVEAYGDCVLEALFEAKAGGSLEIRSLRPAWPTWQNPVSTGKKLARCG
ncbi:putative uncharacterized protein C8orf44, partial [Plecturocebus cupreus]